MAKTTSAKISAPIGTFRCYVSITPEYKSASERISQYEYRTITVAGKAPGLKKEDPEENLNELGKEGFKLVERIEQQFGGTQILILMRETTE